jgi:hypothetical protein
MTESPQQPVEENPEGYDQRHSSVEAHAAGGPSAVDASRVRNAINSAYITVETMGEKTTVLHAQLPNGFEVVTSSSCVDPADFDPEMGEQICRDRLEEKVWELLGFQQHPDL